MLPIRPRRLPITKLLLIIKTQSAVKGDPLDEAQDGRANNDTWYTMEKVDDGADGRTCGSEWREKKKWKSVNHARRKQR